MIDALNQINTKADSSDTLCWFESV